MKLLLDTNALIWWLEDEWQLGKRTRELLANPDHEISATIVSIWEITMKWRAGKYPLPGSAFLNFLDDESIALCGLQLVHLKKLEELPAHHKDPFDHLIIAQAICEDAVIVTSDKEFAEYDVRCFPAML